MFGVALSYTPVNAEELNTEIEYFEDGSYLVTTITEDTMTRASGTKTGTKTANYYSNGKVMWSVAVTGTFTYTSTSAKCTKSSVSTTCPGSTWKISSKSASKSNNIATAKATAKQYQSGVCIFTKTVTVSLGCGANGVLG